MAPGRRRRAEIFVARADAGAVQRREHQRHQRLVRVLDRRRQLARGTRGVLEHRSEEHTSELQSLMRISYAVFCLKKKNSKTIHNHLTYQAHTTQQTQWRCK